MDPVTGMPSGRAPADAASPATAAGNGRNRRARLRVVGGALAVLVALLAAAEFGMSLRARESAAEAALPQAADFTLPTLDGGSFRLSDHRDKVVVVNFWAASCLPCRQELPMLQRTWERERGKGVVVVGVGVTGFQPDAEEAMRRLADELGVTYALAVDGQGSVGQAYGLRGVPTTIVVSPRGRVVREMLGLVTDFKLERALAEARG